MRILCAIGARRGSEVVRHVAAITREGDELVLVHVTDTGPRHDLDRLRGPLHPHHEHREELDAAEEESGKAMLQEALEEAGRLGLTASGRLERGRPEQVIVELAGETVAQLVVLFARESPQAHPRQGPPSVGHTARFVVDHSPAHVLLLRESGMASAQPHEHRAPGT
jgi:nucleotide-binding universal stress UspA family protein